MKCIDIEQNKFKMTIWGPSMINCALTNRVIKRSRRKTKVFRGHIYKDHHIHGKLLPKRYLLRLILSVVVVLSCCGCLMVYNEPHCEKTNNLHMRNQRRRSALQ